MEQEMKASDSSAKQKPKTWDEAILELKDFILTAKKQERQKAVDTEEEH